MDKKSVIIIVACASRKEARRIADSLLKERLVACANIVTKVESSFWWKGRIEKAQEAILIMKTLKVNFKKIEVEVKRLHSYEVPEVVAIPITAGSKSYLDWIKSNT